MDLKAEMDAIAGDDLTSRQAAHFLGVQIQTVQIWCRRHKIPSRKVGARYQIPKAVVWRLLRIPPAPSVMTKPFLTIPEAARELRMNADTLRTWVQGGKVPARRVGYRYQLSRETIRRLMEGLQEQYFGGENDILRLPHSFPME
jgi:excisionase family DNA binding protein